MKKSTLVLITGIIITVFGLLTMDEGMIITGVLLGFISNAMLYHNNTNKA